MSQISRFQRKSAELGLSRHGVADIPDPESGTDNVEAAETPVLKENTPAPKNSDMSVINEAAAFARTSGRELSQFSQDSNDVAEDVLNHCVTAMDQLVEMVSQSAVEPADLVEEIEQAHELLVLMQLEQGDASAADAATVLLQVTHELELAMAA